MPASLALLVTTPPGASARPAAPKILDPSSDPAPDPRHPDATGPDPTGPDPTSPAGAGPPASGAEPTPGSAAWELLYGELRSIAGRMMRGQAPNHTLQTTALLNEAYLRLANGGGFRYESDAQFFALASQVMRTVLVDHARNKQRAKRQAPGERVPLDGIAAAYAEQPIDLVGLDLALVELAEHDPRLVRLVELRYFGGRSMEQAAAILGLSRRGAEREWTFVRGWLQRKLR